MARAGQLAQDVAVDLLLERYFNRTDFVAILAPWGKPCPVEVDGRLTKLLVGHLLGGKGPGTTVRYVTRRRAGTTAGRFRVGSYCPGLDDKTRWLCLDFDGAGHVQALADPQAVA